jgi:hypothetical protein
MDPWDEPIPFDEKDRLAKRLRETISWRDAIAREVVRLDGEIAVDARTFATLNGDLVRPTLDQLRRMLFEGKG